MGRLLGAIAGAALLAAMTLLTPGAAGATDAATDAATVSQTVGPVTKLPLPRYVTLRSNEINVRRGPGIGYPRDWVYRRAGLPVRVVDEFEDWRRIEDFEGAGGWVWHALLTGRRNAIVIGEEAGLHARPAAAAPLVARAEARAVVALRQCRADWCEVEAPGSRGWVAKADLWGVGAAEVWD